jgi:hypothetical protein
MMSDIPIPMIHGTTDSEKIREIESYLSRLSEVLIRELSSIGFQNLSQDLAQKINNAVESHQDLSEYATKSYVKDNFIDNDEIEAYATRDYVSTYYIDNGEIEAYATDDTVATIQNYFVGEIKRLDGRIDKIK